MLTRKWKSNRCSIAILLALLLSPTRALTNDSDDNDVVSNSPAHPLALPIQGSAYEEEAISASNNVDGQRCNPCPDKNNLVYNPQFECDADQNGHPDGWLKYTEDTSHMLDWIEDPTQEKHGMILKSEYDGLTTPTSFGWKQTIILKPNTWYEFSASFATENLQVTLDYDNTIDNSTFYVGACIDIRDTNNNRLLFKSLYSMGPELTDWDEDAWLFRTYKTSEYEPWKKMKTYFKTPESTSHANVRTLQFTKGTVYYDDYSLIEVDNDPTLPPFKASGTLEFIQYKGESFFPIIAMGSPTLDGTNDNQMSLSELRSIGFNVGHNNTTDYSKQEWLDSDLAMLLNVSYVYHTPNVNIPNEWINDPEHEIDYTGADMIRSKIATWKDFENILLFNGPDEIECHPGRFGAWMSYLDMPQAIKDYVNTEVPHAYVYYNFGSGVAITQVHEDLVDYYFPTADIISSTCNTPRAYPTATAHEKLTKCGATVRRYVHSIKDRQYDHKVIAMGLGVYWWSKWDGLSDWSLNTYIPFNLQRYQIYDQIINGAVGVSFYGLYKMHLDDPYYAHHWEQIKRIAKELSRLNDVLLEPRFYDDWSVTDDRIKIMMKKHDQKIYLLTASSHYEDLYQVGIHLNLEENQIISIKALNENTDGNFALGHKRTITPANKTNFFDDFVQQKVADLEPDPDAPGYCVHLYEINYNPDAPLDDPPPIVTTALSFKTHETMGDCAIDVFNGEVECRVFGVSKLVVGFDMDIQIVDNIETSAVSLSSGTVQAVYLSANNELTIEISGTTDATSLIVSFPGIANAADADITCMDSVCIRQLVGDVYPDGVITTLDRLKVQDQMDQVVTASNCRNDVNADGVFTMLDRLNVRNAMGTEFVGTCP